MKRFTCQLFLFFSFLMVTNLQAQEIQFVEQFATATDRNVALQQLIPGTEEYYFFHCLHYQNMRQFAKVDEMTKAWEKRFGNSPRIKEIENRQALLRYDDDPKATLDYLGKELSLQFNHQRQIPEAEQNLPSQLNPDLIDPVKLVNANKSRIDRLERMALPLVSGELQDHRQHVKLLAAIQWPDFPNLVALIEKELQHKDSRGFGAIPIHNRLTLEQLDELASKMTKLKVETNFVNAYLQKLVPSNDVDWRNDNEQQVEYLNRLWDYVSALEPVHNSLKACVRYHQLLVDQRMGKYDREKFVSYLKLPRRVYYINQDFLKRVRNSQHEVNMNANYSAQTRLVPINNDEPVIRDYLHQFLKTTADQNEFAPYIESNYLKTQLATANILNGVGDVEKWASMLSPDQYKTLVERVDLEFLPTNKTIFKPADSVELELHTKNVDKLIVKIFEINTENYYRRFGREIDTDINLDGLVPNDSQTYEYSEAPALRQVRKFEFPKLTDRGVYVIDFIGNGKSSRAIIRKGQLSMLSRITLAGHLFTIVDEDGKPVNGADLRIGGQLFEAIEKDDEKTNQVLVPFSTQPGNQAVIIRNDDFTSLEYFQHSREEYSLTAGMHVDRESLLRVRKSQVVIRPQLRLAGVPIPTGLLDKVRLEIMTTDQDGNQSTSSKNDLELSEGGETIVEFQVPPRLTQVTFRLLGEIENMSVSSTQTVASAASVTVNGIDTSDEIQDVHMVRSGSEFLLEVRGRSGENRKRQSVLVEMKSEYVKRTINVSLQTNAEGKVELGELVGIVWVKATCASGTPRTWKLENDGQSGYGSVHGVVGDDIRITAPPELKRPNPLMVGLFEVRSNTIVKNWFDAIKVGEGLVEISGLEAGDYQLVFKNSGRVTQIRITEGEVVETTIMGKTRRLETRDVTPLHLSEIETKDKTIELKLGGANASTRVHVFATRFVPRFNPLAQLGVVRDTEPFVVIPGVRRSTFMAGRKIGDEYQYILDRRYAKKYVGNMLERPTVLLNPFSISQTENQQDQLQSGQDFGDADDQGRSVGKVAPNQPIASGDTSDFANLDFLQDGTVLLANLRPDENGIVKIDADKLGDKQQLVIVAADMFNTLQRSFAMTASEPETRDLRLANAFDPASNVTQSKQMELLSPDNPFVIEDILTAKFQSFDDLGDIYEVLRAFNSDGYFTEFSFLLTWPDKTDEQKRELYSKYSCHELNFFIFKKDKEFFNAIVKPYISNKREKTFIDNYLLDYDLSDYLNPWKFARLNSVERILLSQRLEGHQADLLQHLNELYRLNPTNRVYAGQLYDSTIAAGWMSNDESKFEGEKYNRLLESGKSLPEMNPSRESSSKKNLGLKDRSRGELELNQLQAGEQQIVDFETNSPKEDSGIRGGRGREAQDMNEERFESRANVYYMEESEGRGAGGGGFGGGVAGRQLRKQSKMLYRRIAQTQEWIEQHYYRLLPQLHNADRVVMNRFWQDYANHNVGDEFVSQHFAEAHQTFTEMLFALSVLDLPFKASEHKTEYVENQMRLTPGSPIIVLHQQMRPAIVERRNTTVLVSENFFQKNDRYRFEDGQQFDKFIIDKFSANTLYGGQVVITNPTSTPRGIELLIQIPKGAVATSGSQETKTIDMDLQPFSTQSFEYSFYFPTAGQFTHFPAHVADDGKVVAVADSVAFDVTDTPTELDKTSWEFVSQNGSNEEVIDFLNTNNVLRLDLTKIAFRMKDKAFFSEVIRSLRRRYAFNDTLWSYSVKHDDIEAINEYLEHASGFVTKCGIQLNSTPLTIEPVIRNWYEHREYSPLINARAHQVGRDRKILNQKFYSQYHKYMSVLARQAELNSEDRLALTYYLLLQDRIEEALTQFDAVKKDEVAEQIQYDYCNAYLNMYLEKPEAAAAIAQLHADHPVDRWRKRFQTVLAHVDEIKGGKPVNADSENQTESQTAMAANAASFDFSIENGEVTVDYQNLSQIEVNYYQMDIELLFSRNPFGQTQGDGFSLIRPNSSQVVQLDESGKKTFQLPEEMRNKNVTIEITGKDQTHSHAYYAHEMTVQLIENYGHLKVTEKAEGNAISKTYVKVYAQNADGSVKFFKDGYTDLRGRFDYATQSNYPLDGVQRFAILIMSDEHGTTVRQAAPPTE